MKQNPIQIKTLAKEISEKINYFSRCKFIPGEDIIEVFVFNVPENERFLLQKKIFAFQKERFPNMEYFLSAQIKTEKITREYYPHMLLSSLLFNLKGLMNSFDQKVFRPLLVPTKKTCDSYYIDNIVTNGDLDHVHNNKDIKEFVNDNGIQTADADEKYALAA